MTRSRGPLAFAALPALFACLACSDGGDEAENGDANGGNVEFSTACSLPGACGGDPSGEWEVVSGCLEPSGEDFDCNWERSARGTVTGTIRFDAGMMPSMGSYSISTEAEMRYCSSLDLSSRFHGGDYDVVDDTLVLDGGYGYSFCVMEDTLWLWDTSAVFPDFSVFELRRDGAGGENGG